MGVMTAEEDEDDDVEMCATAPFDLASYAGLWKIVWVESMENFLHMLREKGASSAFRRKMRHAHGREFEFSIDGGCWVESELSEAYFFGESGAEPVPIDGKREVETLAPTGERIRRRVSFENGILSMHEASVGKREGEVVEQILTLVDMNTMHRRVTNENTGTSFVIVFSRTGLANHHRTLALARELTTPMLAFVPALVFIPVWAYTTIQQGAWISAFREFWPMTIAMVFGSFIAGSTPLGGGIVGFPVAVLALGFDAVEGRDFSAMIQSVGMTSASYLIVYLKPQLVHAKLVTYSIVFGVFGCIVGFAVPIDAFAVNLILTTYIAAFALLYAYKNEVVEPYAIPVPPSASERQADHLFFHRNESHLSSSPSIDVSEESLQRDPSSPSASKRATENHSTFLACRQATTNATRRDLLLILSALLGGFVTAKLGSGSDSMLYIYASFGWNSFVAPDAKLSESTMTASTVVVMATMSIVVFGIRLAQGDISRDVTFCWAAAAPVVCLGAPIGSLILGPDAEIGLRKFFYFIAFLQFIMFAVIVIKTHVAGWTVVAVILVVTISSIAGHYYCRLRPEIRRRVAL